MCVSVCVCVCIEGCVLATAKDASFICPQLCLRVLGDCSLVLFTLLSKRYPDGVIDILLTARARARTHTHAHIQYIYTYIHDIFNR